MGKKKLILIFLLIIALIFFAFSFTKKDLDESSKNNPNGDLKVREEYPCYSDQDEKIKVSVEDRYKFNKECESEISWTQRSKKPEVWKDNTTGLYWSEILTKNIDERMNWEEADLFCSQLDLDSVSKNLWRLPTKDEVMQITPQENEYGYKGGNDMLNATNDHFTQYSLIWTSTEVEELPNSAWTVNPENGFILEELKSNRIDTRCVSRY